MVLPFHRECAMNVLIVDDEPLARAGMRMLLEEESAITSIAEARNGAEAVEIVRAKRPDLLLLDVQMPEMDGFGVLKELGAEQMPPVIFVTAHDKYAIQAFEVNAIDYLLKPVTRERFQQALARVRERVSTQGAGQPSRAVAAAAVVGAAEISRARRAALGRQDHLRQHRRPAVRAGRGKLRAAAPQGFAAPAARADRHARGVARSARCSCASIAR